MALAVSALSDKGIRPAARLAMAVDTPAQGWVVLPPLNQTVQVLSANSAAIVTRALVVKGQPLWQWSGLAGTANKRMPGRWRVRCPAGRALPWPSWFFWKTLTTNGRLISVSRCCWQPCNPDSKVGIR